MRLIPALNTLPSGATQAEGQLDNYRSCAVIPNRTTDPEGFVDTRQELGGYKVFVSVAAVREMARLVGIPDQAEVEALVAEMEARISEQTEELQKLNDLARVIDLKAARKLLSEREPA